MPELPDVTLYVEALEQRIVGQPLTAYAILNPFVLRTVDPPLDAAVGKTVRAVRRLGKRVVMEFDDELYVVIHLMIAGRFRWFDATARKKVPGRIALAEFEFPNGTLVLTEAGTTRRASLHVVHGRDSLAQFDRGGLEVLEATRDEFAERLARENHTLKRSLTDPRLFSGIGNAYSDEILHRARLSPLKLTSRLTDEEFTRLYEATQGALIDWTSRLREDFRGHFPDKVTAFREGMARARAVPETLPRVWHDDPAHPVCEQRDELLSTVSDRGAPIGGSGAIAATQTGLAEDGRRARGIAPAGVCLASW